MKHSTAGQAIQAAAVFCSAIGQPVTATASAVFPEPMVAANPDRPPCWEVSFPGQATVDVCDGTLVIRNYIDFADGCLDGPPGRPEPIANALKTFTVVVTASGQRNLELAPPIVTEQRINPSSKTDDFLDLNANRVYQGIGYFGQDATVDLQAETGTVVDFRLDIQGPPPTSYIQNVSQTQADSIAVATLKALGLTGIKHTETTLAVVQPDPSLQSNPSSPPAASWDANNYVAWVSKFLYNDSLGQEHLRFVEVDVNTGSVLGVGMATWE